MPLVYIPALSSTSWSSVMVVSRSRAQPASEGTTGKRARVNTVLEADKFGSYQPKSRETRDAYGILLQMVQARLGDYPTEILYGAAEEVLTVLKDENKRVRLSCKSITPTPAASPAVMVRTASSACVCVL